MRILIATSNPHKVGEIRGAFSQLNHGETGLSIEWLTLSDLGLTDEPEPVEDADTFAGNARIKAEHYARLAGMRCLAEDSGLTVDALDGAPGVRSARFSGEAGPRRAVDLANNALLLRRMADVPRPQRGARFVCTMMLVDPDGETVAQAAGEMAGRILGPGDPGYAPDNPAGVGEHGFGYDPLFWLGDLACTSAQLRSEEKDAISHRGAATRRLWVALRRLESRRSGRPT